MCARPSPSETIAWNDAGLVAAIVQDAGTGQVRMLGWMNREALERTVETGQVWFYSRSRAQLWRKGESSGNTLDLVELRVDCDRDAVLVRARPVGPTCHTGADSCFFEPLDDRSADGGPPGAPAHVLDDLFTTLLGRRDADPGASYTARLLAGGVPAATAKIVEEAGELTRALAAEPDERVAAEAADLIYHLLVGLVARDVSADAVWAALERRRGTSGLVEKAGRSK